MSCRAVHALEERAARAPVAVLARDGAAVLEHEVEDLVGDGLDLLEPARRLEVDHGADVQAADRAVAVVGALGVVLGHDLAEARHELRQVLGVDGGVLDEGDGLVLALHAEEEAEPGLAELPDGLLLGGVEGDVGGVAEALARAPRLERLDLGADLGRRLPRVLDDQDGGRDRPARSPCASTARCCSARGRGSSCRSARPRRGPSRGWPARTRAPPACRGSG